MTAAAVVTPRPSLIERLLNWWFDAPATSNLSATGGTTRPDRFDDLRSALEAASSCQVSALSAEYAHYLIDRHSRHMGERG